ncbi:MAG: hypothetical protein V2J02_01610 [Pseudomonadales bacterium]|jgi:hypothetical protein|nr:hypothetical protein [Pseudomonadales bacterium]
MRPRSLSRAAALLTAALWVAACATPSPSSDEVDGEVASPPDPAAGFDEARAAASRNAEDPRAQLFFLDLAPHVGLLLSTRPRRYLPCFEAAGPEPIEVLVRLDPRGRVLETRYREDHPGNACFARWIRQEILPYPPEGDWWTWIHLEGRGEVDVTAP